MPIQQQESSTATSRRAHVPLLVVAALVTASVLASVMMRSSVAATATRSVHFTSGGAGPITFTGQLSRGAVLQGGDGQVRVKLSIAADPTEVAAVTSVPTDLIVVLDRSGSMEGSKIDDARRALGELVSQLGTNDRFALVSYAYDASLDISLETASAAAKRGWRRAARALQVGGGTNMSAGIELALDTLAAREAGRAARLILLSDGLANEGDASFEGLTGRARRAAHREYVMSAVGIGEDFNEYLMSGIADAGTGNYYYLQKASDLASVFSREFDATRTTVASGVDVTIEPGAGVAVVDAGGYPLEHDGDRVRFRPGSLFAGQEREIWVTLSVPVDAPGEHDLGEFVLGYTSDGARRERKLGGPVKVACVPDRERMLASVDKKVWEASVVNDDYQQLKEDVARAVKQGRQQDAERAIVGYRSRNSELNQSLASPVVEKNLNELDALEQEVEEAFTGDDQAVKQNRLSKAYQASSWDGRRAGSKKAPK